MALVSLFLEPVPPGSTTRGVPRLVITGARRRLAQKAVRALNALLSADKHEASRATRMNYTPQFVVGDAASPEVASLLIVLNQIEYMLAQRA